MIYTKVKILENTIANSKVVFTGDIINVDEKQLKGLLISEKAKIYIDSEEINFLKDEKSYILTNEDIDQSLTKKLLKRGK